jgi:hypothetical protein
MHDARRDLAHQSPSVITSGLPVVAPLNLGSFDLHAHTQTDKDKDTDTDRYRHRLRHCCT